jgi:hypothetical protein
VKVRSEGVRAGGCESGPVGWNDLCVMCGWYGESKNNACMKVPRQRSLFEE